MYAVEYSALSDIGCERSSNQDRWGADEDQRLFIVADGVGGSRDGALAAQRSAGIHLHGAGERGPGMAGVADHERAAADLRREK